MHHQIMSDNVSVMADSDQWPNWLLSEPIWWLKKGLKMVMFKNIIFSSISIDSYQGR